MKPYSILTVDLNNDVSSQQRTTFGEKLTESKWKKMPDLTTVWYTTWAENVTEEGMINTTKKDVQEAADAANIKHYDVSTAICLKPVSWKK